MLNFIHLIRSINGIWEIYAVFEFQSLQDKCDRLEKKSAENDNQRKSESDKTTELDRKLEVSLVLV